MRGLAIVVVVAAGATRAAAQPADSDKLEADRLFADGRALLAAGKPKEACAKFDLSARKDPRAVGTLLNLAQCHEIAGEVSTAYNLYAEARARAKDQDLKEHREAAERKLALLAPRVPHLAITGVPAGAKVIVDRLVLADDQRAGVPADPGPRTITVTAPGKL